MAADEWASDAEILQYQRMAAQLYGALAIPGFLTLLLPHWDGTHEAAGYVVLCIILGAAVALLRRRSPLPRRAVQAMPLPGLMFITASIWVHGPEGSGTMSSLYTMLALGAFTFLPARVGLSYLALAAAIYAGMLINWGVHAWPAQVVMMLGTSLIASYTAGKLMRRIRVLAWHDELTGLANRRAWYHRLGQEIARARRRGTSVTIAIIDFDHFKAVNDTGGHDAGDRLLRAAAAAWSAQLRLDDTLARWGGDEFGVLLVDCDVEGALVIIDRMRACTPGGQTISAGVATWEPHEAPDDVVIRADRALYQAKNAGRALTMPAQESAKR